MENRTHLVVLVNDAVDADVRLVAKSSNVPNVTLRQLESRRDDAVIVGVDASVANGNVDLLRHHRGRGQCRVSWNLRRHTSDQSHFLRRFDAGLGRRRRHF